MLGNLGKDTHKLGVWSLDLWQTGLPEECPMSDKSDRISLDLTRSRQRIGQHIQLPSDVLGPDLYPTSAKVDEHLGGCPGQRMRPRLLM